MQLMTLNGCQSNPDVPGVERLVCTWLQPDWLQLPRSSVPANSIKASPALLGAGDIFMVKGWNRSVAALGVLFAAYACPDACPELLQAGFCVLHSDASVFKFQLGGTPARGDSAPCMNIELAHQIGTYQIDLPHFTPFLKRSFSVMHATVVAPDSTMIVNTNRGHFTADLASSDIKLSLIQFKST